MLKWLLQTHSLLLWFVENIEMTQVSHSAELLCPHKFNINIFLYTNVFTRGVLVFAAPAFAAINKSRPLRVTIDNGSPPVANVVVPPQ